MRAMKSIPKYGQVNLADPKGALLPQLVLLHQDFPLNILVGETSHPYNLR
jgi:hypothetical protein